MKATEPLATRSAFPALLLPVCALAWLWFRLIEQLRISWSLSPQYAYGWAVPFLCLYLTWRRVGANGQRPEGGSQAPERPLPSSIFCLLFAVGAFLYAPIHLVQAANPGWSLATWPLAFITIGLTLLALYALVGPWSAARVPLAGMSGFHRFRFSDFVFPICFLLVAVPWPFVIEQPVIQGLTRLNTALTVEILGLLGIPALPRGNVIELATGSVGIDEACSGIRSLQATLMISLFFGEFHRLTVSRRLICVCGGFALALVCNLARTLLLCWVAAERGVAAIAGWHDPAGVTILVGCFAGLWIIARTLQRVQMRGQRSLSPQPSVLNRNRISAGPTSAPLGLPAFQRFGLFLTASLVVVEIGVGLWYRHVEANLPAQATWQIAWPATNAVCRDIPIGHKAAKMLRYDQARQVQWVEPAGTRWQLSWFYWKPGRAAGYLAKTHNPLICMPAAGFQAVSTSPVEYVEVSGLRVPVRMYQFAEERNSVYVLYSRWEDRAVEQSFGGEGVTRFNRLRSIWNGRGNQGQRVISLALWTADDAAGAREQLIRQLRNLLLVDPLR